MDRAGGTASGRGAYQTGAMARDIPGFRSDSRIDSSPPSGGDDGAAGGGPAPAAFTIGHSTRSAEEFVSLLEENGVELLVDVRRHPGSRRHPQFNQGELEETLRAAGIDYRHEERLGGRRDPAPGESPNRAWESEGFRAYADHLLSEEGRRALDHLESEARERRLAVMCAEAVPWRCHRQIVADHLVARGLAVRHVLGEGRTDGHSLRRMAEVGEDGRVVYPGTDVEQPELFE